MPINRNQHQTRSLYLTVERGGVSTFFPILSQGFIVKTKVGCTLRDLICNHLGLSADYMEQRLQTIFLDGKAVDDTETTVIRQGSTLALSAAMPGLAGATLRRGSAYAAMRDQITYKKHTDDECVEDGTIHLKLFNLVAEDIGELFLTRGIWIRGENLQDFFLRAPEQCPAGCRSVEVDGVQMKAENLGSIDWKQAQVFLKLKVI